jgi:biotin operon repressor
MSAVDAMHDHIRSFEEYRRSRQPTPTSNNFSPGVKPFLGAKVRKMLLEGRGPASVQRLTGCSRATIKRAAAMLRQEGYDITIRNREMLPNAAPSRLVVEHEFPALPVDVGQALRKAASARGTDSNGLAAAILTNVVRDGLIDAVLEK